MKQLLLSFFLVATLSASAQYWFGPTGGIQITQHKYLSEHYRDTFSIPLNLGWHVGGSVTYTASRRYSVHGEINYLNIGKSIEYRDDPDFASGKSTYHYLAIPMMMRVNFGRTPFRFYVNGGVRLNFWLAGKGHVALDELREYDITKQEYKIVYKQSKFDNASQPHKLALVEPNRVQYGFAVGGGLLFGLFNGSEIMLDFRYNLNQSNMGFNGSPNFKWETYEENFEFRLHSVSVSVAYLTEFNAQLKRKGASTNPNSKRR